MSRKTDRGNGQGVGIPSWLAAFRWSVLVTASMLASAVALNILIGRTIHWEWVAILGALVFGGLAAGRRLRLV